MDFSHNHIPQERVGAFRNILHICKFVTKVNNDYAHGDADTDLDDALEESIIHMQTTEADLDTDKITLDP